MATPAEELQSFAAALREPRAALEAAAAEARALVATSLATRTSPDGTPWPAERLVSRSGRSFYYRQPNRRTGRLEGAVSVRAERATIVFDAPLRYAGFVQDGTSDSPARRFLPFDGTGAPMETGPAGEFWRRFEERLADYPLEEAFGGR